MPRNLFCSAMKLLLLACCYPFFFPGLLRPESSTEEYIISPNRVFTITQTRGEEGVTGVLTFKSSQRRFILHPSPISWRGFYSISPDARWVLRIQKTGSGDNNAWLYEVRDGTVSAGQDLGSKAWEFHHRVAPVKCASLYHTGFELLGWESDGCFLLSLHGTCNDETDGHHVRDFVVRYNPSAKRFTKLQKSLPAQSTPILR